MDVSARRVVGYVPVTVLGIALVSGALAAGGIRFHDVFEFEGLPWLLNPFNYTVNMLFHADWGHYAGNMRLWLPFGILMTWLTSNRHVLWLVVTIGFGKTATGILIQGPTVGMSGVVFGVGAAVLVRSTGYALQDSSLETLQIIVFGLLTPLATGFLLVMIFAGPRWIADFSHFLGFLFGGAIEAMYVFDEHEDGRDSEGRTISKTVGR
ncbi:rhomboid family intramembrane serine protease [Haloarcula salinisoli]|uniref:Rhomboid family intramembrane serine protease n=1 Tax=Haloarcula salinisoli TaxID=2487746 RepID=A0A8J7YM78_9EURY|nr:rhomboid family intramembrane serine protease [Halomicroarcula salinisoli]MBX0287053.1 rhomboid family intramembrane serine protease [Halomicroarcula salinisoli]MBX0304356.1 rhomboid family intramembrane serine protease [Halomicroarcula salinisoli]